MSGIIITGIGVGMIVFAVILFVTLNVYHNTAGKKTQNELGKEYG